VGDLARGQVVLVGFPFSDLSRTKRRPALVLAVVEYGDLLLCQITSRNYGDRNAIELGDADFESGGLPQTSYARPGRLVTADPALVVRPLGSLLETKRAEVVAAIGVLLA
jgi:mRNA interferase MazF